MANPCALSSSHLHLAMTCLRVDVLLMSVGTDKDYVQWLAHSDDISDPNDGCILGYKEKFLRLKKDSVCLNGRDYEVNTQPAPCLCTLDDFLWYDGFCFRCRCLTTQFFFFKLSIFHF